MTSTKILTRRRLGAHGVPHAPVLVRRRRTRGFVQVASSVTAERLRLNTFGHAYLGLGALLIAVVQNGMNLMGISSNPQKVVLGLVILAAAVIDRLKQGRAGE